MWSRSSEPTGRPAGLAHSDYNINLISINEETTKTTLSILTFALLASVMYGTSPAVAQEAIDTRIGKLIYESHESCVKPMSLASDNLVQAILLQDLGLFILVAAKRGGIKCHDHPEENPAK